MKMSRLGRGSGKIATQKGGDIIKKVELTMDEEKKYSEIKRLVDEGGNKDRAALNLGITRRQVNRLIKAYRERGKAAFVHGNRGRQPATTIPVETRAQVVELYRTKYCDANSPTAAADPSYSQYFLAVSLYPFLFTRLCYTCYPLLCKEY